MARTFSPDRSLVYATRNKESVSIGIRSIAPLKDTHIYSLFFSVFFFFFSSLFISKTLHNSSLFVPVRTRICILYFARCYRFRFAVQCSRHSWLRSASSSSFSIPFFAAFANRNHIYHLESSFLLSTFPHRQLHTQHQVYAQEEWHRKRDRERSERPESTKKTRSFLLCQCVMRNESLTKLFEEVRERK